MKGFVPTPGAVVDLMVAKLFADRPPQPDDVVLDPGCGEGEFIAGILRWAEAKGAVPPRIVGVESNPAHGRTARAKFHGVPVVEILVRDFLTPHDRRYQYVVGNPPYVPITGLTESERNAYRSGFVTATGRFDLYLLFFEQAVLQLLPGGRLVFITPEKYLYVDTARPLRRILAQYHVAELQLLQEDTFPGLVTYPLVTTLDKIHSGSTTRVIHRNGMVREARLAGLDASWLPIVSGIHQSASDYTLSDLCERISCGVATGADAVFVVSRDRIPAELIPFAHRTIAGRELGPAELPEARNCLLMPYDRSGNLLDPARAEPLLRYLSVPDRKTRLLARTCSARKPWYAFHETPNLDHIQRPKLLCKDIGSHPRFFMDPAGALVPRHSVYYLVPRSAHDLEALCRFLNSSTAQEWLWAHCQRAANGFVRLQSQVLKRLPVPAEVVAGLEGLASPRVSLEPVVA